MHLQTCTGNPQQILRGSDFHLKQKASSTVLNLAMKFFRAFAAIALGLIASFSLQGCGSSDDGVTGMNETTTEMMTVNTTTMETTTTMM